MTEIVGKVNTALCYARVVEQEAKKERNADSFPFDNAVNAAELKIFSPQNRKLYGKIKNPFLVIS